MTKKDFELIARFMLETTPNDNADTAQDHHTWLIAQLSRTLATTNSRFDRGRFIAACMGDES